MKLNLFRTGLIIASGLVVVASAAQAKWWKFGKNTQETQATQATQSSPVNYSQGTSTQYQQQGYTLAPAQQQQHHKLRFHLPFFSMGAF